MTICLWLIAGPWIGAQPLETLHPVLIRLNPDATGVLVGATTSIRCEVVLCATALGAYNFRLRYTPEFIRVTRVRGGTTPEFGAPVFSRIFDATVIATDFQGASLQNPQGTIHVFTLEVVGVADGLGTLTFERTELVTAQGDTITGATNTAVICVNGPCPPTPTPTRVGRTREELLRQADLDLNGIVDEGDLFILSELWHEHVN